MAVSSRAIQTERWCQVFDGCRCGCSVPPTMFYYTTSTSSSIPNLPRISRGPGRLAGAAIQISNNTSSRTLLRQCAQIASCFRGARRRVFRFMAILSSSMPFRSLCGLFIAHAGRRRFQKVRVDNIICSRVGKGHKGIVAGIRSQIVAWGGHRSPPLLLRVDSVEGPRPVLRQKLSFLNNDFEWH